MNNEYLDKTGGWQQMVENQISKSLRHKLRMCVKEEIDMIGWIVY